MPNEGIVQACITSVLLRHNRMELRGHPGSTIMQHTMIASRLNPPYRGSKPVAIPLWATLNTTLTGPTWAALLLCREPLLLCRDAYCSVGSRPRSPGSRVRQCLNSAKTPGSGVKTA